jgi:hypothetical protein
MLIDLRAKADYLTGKLAENTLVKCPMLACIDFTCGNGS